MQSKDEVELEAQLQASGLNAPRITPDDIDAAIVNAQYHHFPGTNHTVCCLTLANGHTVVGESACVSGDNFKEAIGRDIAYRNARDKIWPLEGYRLQCNLRLREALAAA
jgi:hypothetical protein